MKTQIKYANSSTLLFLGLGLFSIAYWVGALTKPVHVDEFFSWVYAERSSFQDILLMKEFGIGHPPLFHLLQKTVQLLIPYMGIASLRLINYFIGLVFIVVLAKIIPPIPRKSYLFLGSSVSAAVLNTFILARMWGLIMLFSALLIWLGERVVENKERKGIICLVMVFIGGLIADFNFFLLLPYFLGVILSGNRYFKQLNWLGLFILTGMLGVLLIRHSYVSLVEIPTVFLILTQQLEEVFYQIGIMIFQLWFKEPLLIAVSIFCLSFFWTLSKQMRTKNKLSDQAPPNGESRKVGLSIFLLLASFFIMLEIILKLEWCRTIHLVPIYLLLFVWGWYQWRKIQIPSIDIKIYRWLFALAGAVLILLAAHQIFWRDLLIARFLMILFPPLLLLFYSYLPVPSQKVLMGLFLISGIIFLFSSGLGDNYPPPHVEAEQSVIVYQDIYAYSTDYFHQFPLKQEPFMLDFSPFEKFCKICRLGKRFYPEAKFDTVIVVHRHNQPLNEELRKKYTIYRIEEAGLTVVDQLAFKYFSPIYTRRYSLFYLVRG